MPNGSHLQFRYESRLIPNALQLQLAGNTLSDCVVCIAYLDKSDKGRVPEVIPCRVAKLSGSKVSGDIYILSLTLEDLWVADDIPAFNKEIHILAANLPRWQGGADVEGSFCQTVSSSPSSLRKTQKPGDWQQLVTSLKKHTDFASEPFFYFVSEILKCGNKSVVELSNGAYPIEAGKTYEIRIIQYSPSESGESITVGESCWLIAHNEDEEISFITPKTLAIDSPYDERFFRFRVPHPTVQIDSTIALLRQTSPGSPETSKAIWDFDLAFRIAPDYWAPLWKGGLIGSLIAAQGVVSIYANPNIADKWWPCIFAGMAGLAAGFIASYGLRKI